MSVPANFVQQPGVGSVSADQFNTFVQTVLNYAALRNFTGQTYMAVQVLGTVTPGDGGQGVFWWNGNSTAADNNASVIVPYGSVGQGAWILQPVQFTFASKVRYTGNVVADSATASDYFSTVAWNSTTSSTKTEVLPPPTTNGAQITVKDAAQTASAYPIAIICTGYTIVGASTINVNSESLTFQADGATSWLVI